MLTEATDGGSQETLSIRAAQNANADSRQLQEYHAAREEEAYKRQFALHQPRPLDHLLSQQPAPGQHAMAYGDDRPRRRTLGSAQGYSYDPGYDPSYDPSYDPHQSQPMYPDHHRRHTHEQAEVTMGGMDVGPGADPGAPALEAHRDMRELPSSHRGPSSADLQYQDAHGVASRRQRQVTHPSDGNMNSMEGMYYTGDERNWAPQSPLNGSRPWGDGPVQQHQHQQHQSQQHQQHQQHQHQQHQQSPHHHQPQHQNQHQPWGGRQDDYASNGTYATYPRMNHSNHSTGMDAALGRSSWDGNWQQSDLAAVHARQQQPWQPQATTSVPFPSAQFAALSSLESIATRQRPQKQKRASVSGFEGPKVVSEPGAENWSEGNDAANLRKGKWTLEEEAYARRMMDHFSEGMVMIPEGVTLRAYLSKQLACDRMRITKKFRGICFGGKYMMCTQTHENYRRMKNASIELQALEVRFKESLEKEEEEKRSQLPPRITATNGPENREQGPASEADDLGDGSMVAFQQEPAAKKRRGEKVDIENPSRSLLLILGQKYLAQLKTHAQKSLVDELKGSLTGSSLLFDLSKGDADLESLVKADGGFVGPTSMLKITMTEGGSQAEGVDIDVDAIHPEKVPTPLPSWRSLGENQTNPNVLVVDDSSSIRKFMQISFEKKGYTVHIATNGQEALDLMKETNFDCVFLDLEMPLMSGFSAATAFREWEGACRGRSRRQPICALSAHSGAKEKDMCEKVGVDFFESKPAMIPGLLRIAELCIRLQTPTAGSRELGSRAAEA